VMKYASCTERKQTTILRLPDTLPDSSGIPCHLVLDLSPIRLIPLPSPHCNVTLIYMQYRDPVVAP
jgi:hypothetical protein